LLIPFRVSRHIPSDYRPSRDLIRHCALCKDMCSDRASTKTNIMTLTHGIQNIEKLTENNYESWKLQMRSILMCNDLWEYVSGGIVKTEKNAEVWIIKDQKALSLIMLGVSCEQLNYVKKTETSQIAWEQLKHVHESKGPVRKTTLYKQLYRLKKNSETTMNKYINTFTNKTEQLTKAEIKIPDNLLSIMLLSSLPDEFKNFSIAIESCDEIPNIDSLKVKLLEEKARQNERTGRNEPEKGHGNNALQCTFP